MRNCWSGDSNQTDTGVSIVSESAVTTSCDSPPPSTAPSRADDEREARFNALLGSWWRDERPAWTEEGWWDATLDEPVRRLLWLDPGPLLVSALDDLAPSGLCPMPHVEDRMLPGWPTPGHAPGWPCACQVVVAAAWDACASWLATRCAASLVAAAGPDVVSFDVAGDRQQIHDPAREELAHALRSTIPAMSNRIGHARALIAQPQLVALVESATISAWAARRVLDHVADLDQEEAEAVLAEVCLRVQNRLSSNRRPYHSAEVNRLARAARLRVCPESAQQARVRAFSDRRVTVNPAGNGMATLVAELADIDAHRIQRRLTALAAGLQADASPDGHPDPRTRDQLRADVLVDLLLGARAPRSEVADPAAAGGPNDTTPRPGSPSDATRAEIQVIVSLETLLGLSQDLAEVPGLGPVPSEVARALACDGRWWAWVTDAAGAVTATGTRGYVPSAGLARLIRAREPRCRFPGCHQPATRCDLDHAVPWPHGATTPENLGPLCRRHHNLKTHTPWVLDPDPPPGRKPAETPNRTPDTAPGWRWRTPAGLTVTDGPEPPLEQHRAPDAGKLR